MTSQEMEENYDEDEDEEMDEHEDEEGEDDDDMEYDEEGSENSSVTQPDEGDALEDALGTEIEEPAEGWQDIDEEMHDDDDGDEDEDDVDEEGRDDEEMLWEVRRRLISKRFLLTKKTGWDERQWRQCAYG